MNRDEIIRMAREAARSENSRLLGCGLDDLERFYRAAFAAGAAAEREECAKVCEQWGTEVRVETWDMAGKDCAAAIRARGKA